MKPYCLILAFTMHPVMWMGIMLLILILLTLVVILVRQNRQLHYVTIGSSESKSLAANTGSSSVPLRMLGESLHKPDQPSDDTILIISADAELRNYLNKELADFYQVSVVEGGEDTLDKIVTGEVKADLILCDSQAAPVYGMPLVKVIKMNARVMHIPVIMFASNAGYEERIAGLRLGADAVLSKPFMFEELVASIDSVLSNLRRHQSKFSGIFEPNNPQLEESVRQSANTDAKLLDHIVQVCNQNMSDADFSVEQLCSEVGISRTQLHRKMKEISGIGMGEFLRNLRLEQAAKLLEADELNVSEVAYAVGYTNIGHFSKTFRRHFGVAPSMYHQTVKKHRN